MSDDRLRLLVERIERISEDIAGLQQDRRDIYAEAKATGYHVPTLRKVVARRKLDPSAREEADALLDTYEAALLGLQIADDLAALRVSIDPALSGLIAGPAKPDKLTKKAKASASLRAASQMAARALRGEI